MRARSGRATRSALLGSRCAFCQQGDAFQPSWWSAAAAGRSSRGVQELTQHRPDPVDTCFHSGEVLSGDRGRLPRMRGNAGVERRLAAGCRSRRARGDTHVAGEGRAGTCLRVRAGIPNFAIGAVLMFAADDAAWLPMSRQGQCVVGLAGGCFAGRAERRQARRRAPPIRLARSAFAGIALAPAPPSAGNQCSAPIRRAGRTTGAAAHLATLEERDATTPEAAFRFGSDARMRSADEPSPGSPGYTETVTRR